MAKLGYTTEFKTETQARAYGRELPIPWKKSVELARQLRGKKVERALVYLDNVVALKQPVPYRRYNRWVAHKRKPVKGMRPRAHGRSTPWDKDTVNLEVVLEEVQ